ncbi:MAG: hypothetical protein AAF705_06505, partial [Bacteroidota bacterium]
LSIGNQNFSILSDFNLPLLTYVIRPAYGLPYPEDFLEDGTFDFQRTGMTGTLLTSGKIRSLGYFQQFRFRLGLASLLTSQQHEIGLSYLFDYLNVKDIKPVRQIKNGLQLSGTFKF